MCTYNKACDTPHLIGSRFCVNLIRYILSSDFSEFFEKIGCVRCSVVASNRHHGITRRHVLQCCRRWNKRSGLYSKYYILLRWLLRHRKTMDLSYGGYMYTVHIPTVAVPTLRSSYSCPEGKAVVLIPPGAGATALWLRPVAPPTVLLAFSFARFLAALNRRSAPDGHCLLCVCVCTG